MGTPRRLVHSLACLSMIAALSGCATLDMEQHFDDPTITAKVKAALANDPTLNKFKIEVTTIKGEVVLRGNVASQKDVVRAAEVVGGVGGVSSLFNDLSVGNKQTP